MNKLIELDAYLDEVIELRKKPIGSYETADAVIFMTENNNDNKQIKYSVYNL